jgi:hypothetical protein
MLKLRSHFVAGIACLGFVVSQPASLLLGATPGAASRSLKRDVELTPDGQLMGRVVNGQGKLLANKPVLMTRGDHEYRTVTDRQGKFRVRDLRGGTYSVSVDGTASIVRVWKAGTAPPGARQSALIVTDELLMRAQCNECTTCVGGGDCGGGCVGGYGLYDWISDHPVLSYSLLTAAIAVPIIIAADDDDDPAS